MKDCGGLELSVKRHPVHQCEQVYWVLFVFYWQRAGLEELPEPEQGKDQKQR